MTETNANYKVGDKVRIMNAEAIKCGSGYWENGDVTAVLTLAARDLPRLSRYNGDTHGLIIAPEELRYIEKVADKPTKNQRISALESEVSALKAEVEALRQAQGKTGKLRILAVDPSVTNIAPIPTPNELRKAIIAEARAFVADTKKQIGGVVAPNMPGAGTHMTFKDVYSTIYDGTKAVCKAEFFVNPNKRTVTVLLKGVVTGKLYAKAIAKCAPGDVFNADIGKAIALGRALGLDVSKFEQAVQPTEFAVGQKTKGHIRYFGKVTKVSDGKAYTEIGSHWKADAVQRKAAFITDDTEAQYE